MASPFQKYQGGGFELPNIAQAGANIGQTLQQGLSSFGQSIGKGIMEYNAGIMQNQAADAKLAAAIRNTGMLASSLEMHPDYKDIAGSLAAKLEEYKGVVGKGLGQKLAAINDLETSSQTVQQAIQYQNMAAEAMALQAYNETPEKKAINAHGILAENGWRPGDPGSIGSAITNLVRQVRKNNEVQNVNPGDLGYTDPKQALGEVLGRARVGIKKAIAENPNDLTLLNADSELEGAIKSYSGVMDVAGADSISGIGKGLLDIYKGMAQQSTAEQAMAPEKPVADAAKKLEIATAAAKGEEKKRLDAYMTDVNVASGLNYFLEKLERGESINTWDYNRARGIVARLPNNALYIKGLSDQYGPNPNVVEFDKIMRKYGKKIDNLMGQTEAGAVISHPTPEQQAELIKLKESLQSEIVRLTSEKAKDVKVRPEEMQAKLFPETKVETKKPVELSMDIAANRAVEAQLSPDERSALAREALAKSDYVQKRFGGRIPAAALQALQSKILTPPPMVTDPATGARLYQSAPGKWEQLKVDKGDSSVQINQTLFPADEEAVASGKQPQFMLKGGKFKDETEKGTFINTMQKRYRGIADLERLIEISNMSAESVSPTLIGEAQTLVNRIVASNRIDLVGPGPVAVAEWQMLERLVQNPTDIWTLGPTTRSNLTTLRKSFVAHAKDDAHSRGVILTPVQSGAEVGRSMRVKNLVNRTP